MTEKYEVNGDVTDVEMKDVQIDVVADEDVEFEDNCCSRVVSRVQDGISLCLSRNKQLIWGGIKFILVFAYLTYFGYCLYYRFGDEGSIRLIAVTVFGVLLIVNKLTPGCFSLPCLKMFNAQWTGNPRVLTARRWIRRSLYVLFTVGMAVYIGLVVVKTNPENIQSLLGVGVFILIAFLASTWPARVNWHPVFWGVGVQFIFALVILRTGWGYAALAWLGHRVEEFLSHGHAGAKYVFGANYKDHRLAFAAMPILIFFNSIMSVLYHIGVIQSIVKTLGSFLAFCLDIGPIESVVAAANIFIGLSEAPLFVRPFLKMVTVSELHAIMTCGFASVSGGVIGTYVLYGVPAKHLLSASVMSAPAALAITKLMCPETKKSVFSQGVKMEIQLEKHRNVLAALSSGAVAAVKIVANILANMIAFVSMLKFADMTLAWFGERAGVDGLSFELVCSYLFYPISYVMGVAAHDCGKMGAMLGKKIFGSPTLAYIDLGTIRENRQTLLNYVSQYNDTWRWVGGDIVLAATNQTLLGGVMDERTEVIGTYALCGFSTVTSIGIALGALIPIAPERKTDIVKLVVRSLIAGNIASFMTGAIAGLMYNGESF